MCAKEILEIPLYKPYLYTLLDQNLKYPNFKIVVSKATEKCWEGSLKLCMTLK